MEISTPAGDDEVGVLVGIISVLFCFLYPVKLWWDKLSYGSKVKIIATITFVVGAGDNILDWVVAIIWIDDDLPVRGSLMIVCIFLGGFLSWASISQYEFNEPCNVECSNVLKLPLYISGLAVFFHTYNVLCMGEGNIEENGKVLKHMRIIEVMFEAIPGGALQLFIMFLDQEFLLINIISVIFSIISTSYAIEQVFAHELKTEGRATMIILLAMDFFYRVVPIAVCFRDLSVPARYGAAAAIFGMEWILATLRFLWDSYVADGDRSCSCRVTFFAFGLTIPALASCIGPLLLRAEDDLTPSHSTFVHIITRWGFQTGICIFLAISSTYTKTAYYLLPIGFINILLLFYFFAYHNDEDLHIGGLGRLIVGEGMSGLVKTNKP